MSLKNLVSCVVLTIFSFGLILNPSASANAIFPDVPSNHPHALDIYALANSGVVGGYPDGGFYPDRSVSRGEMAVFIFKGLFPASPTNTTCGNFSDVPVGAAFYEEITTLKCIGIIKGYSDGTFRSNRSVSREEALVFTINSLLKNGKNIPAAVNDPIGLNHSDTAGSPFLSFIERAFKLGLICGYGDATFGPRDTLPRSQLSTMINKARNFDSLTKCNYSNRYKYKHYSGRNFKRLFDGMDYLFADRITTAPHITGDAQADQRIRSIAEGRGYELQEQTRTDRLQNLGGKLLQPEAASAWNAMRSAAAAAGHDLVLVSAYRSPSDQRNIFNSALNTNGVSVNEIKTGQADSTIDAILKTRSIPGYSRHHNGYTIDLGCNGANLIAFGNTSCFLWMSGGNYYNAKRFGFIPSYPEGAGLQGPNPEPWEYIYVGEGRLVRD